MLLDTPNIYMLLLYRLESSANQKPNCSSSLRWFGSQYGGRSYLGMSPRRVSTLSVCNERNLGQGCLAEPLFGLESWNCDHSFCTFPLLRFSDLDRLPPVQRKFSLLYRKTSSFVRLVLDKRHTLLSSEIFKHVSSKLNIQCVRGPSGIATLHRYLGRGG